MYTRCSHAVRDFEEGFRFAPNATAAAPSYIYIIFKTIALQEPAFDRLKVFADICRMAHSILEYLCSKR